MRVLKTIAGALLWVFVVFPTLAQEEEPTGNVLFNAYLGNVLDLDIVANDKVMEFDFTSTTQYIEGISLPSDEVTEISVEASVDWKVQLEAQTATFSSQGEATGSIPLNDLGFYVVETGAHTAEDELIIIALDIPSTKMVTSDAVTVIDVKPGEHNIGDAWDNRFRFMWQMGTGNGDMSDETLLDQMEQGQFSVGTHTLVVLLTLSQSGNL